MPPWIALLLVGSAIIGMLIVDSRRKLDISTALWIPLIWTAILASRSVSNWYNWYALSASELSAAVEDGSPADRAVLSLLMVIAAFILLKRKLQLTRLFQENKWIVLFLLYCGISILWSDFPAVAVKRLIRALGAVMMILVVLSDPDPIAAIGTVVRRCAYILVPVSILLIKYYRSLGVGYDQWTGELMLVGVAYNKNGLGRICLVAGIFLLWDIVTTWRNKNARSDKLNRSVSALLLLLTVWLLLQSHSATSLAAFLVGSSIIVGLGLPVFRKSVRYLGSLVILTASIVMVVGVSSLLETAVVGLGRDMTFTTRTRIWEDLLNMGTNPFVGVGYDSFWLGDRLDSLVRKYQINEAHNGYLEVYLELGLTGLCLLAGLAINVFFKAKKSLSQSFSFDFGRLRMAMLAIFLVYNVTEAASKATTLMFFVLLLVAIDLPVKLASREPVTAIAEPRALRPARRRSTTGARFSWVGA